HGFFCVMALLLVSLLQRQLGQTSNQAGNADVDAFLTELTLQEANEQQSHDAEESMHADFLVGPMMHGPPATGFGIFHGAKAILQLVLPPVPEHDVFARPSQLIGKEDRLSEQARHETALLLLVDFEVEANSLGGVFHFRR